MKKVIISFMLMISGFLLKANENKVIYIDSLIPDSFHQSIRIVIDKYEKIFCLIHDTFYIKVGLLPNLVFAQTNNNVIQIDNEYLSNASVMDFYETIKHEMYHTNTDENKEVFFRDLYYGLDSVRFIGSVGLMLFAEKAGEDASCTHLNEGCAELCGFLIDSVYRRSSKQYYYGYGTLVYMFVKAKWITPFEIMEYNKNSDIKAFCSKILDREVSIREIDIILGYFTIIKSPKDIEKSFKGIKYLRENKLK